jgi:hypothetical protein
MSYTKFDYAAAGTFKSSYKSADTISVSVNIKNTGNYNGDEVLQAYIQYPQVNRMPLKELKGFKRVSVAKGSRNKPQLSASLLANCRNGTWIPTNGRLYPGEYKLILGSNSQEEKLSLKFTVKINRLSFRTRYEEKPCSSCNITTCHSNKISRRCASLEMTGGLLNILCTLKIRHHS